MTAVPITHMTLYKHGVGYFQRQARCSGDQVSLTFRVEEMNDVLKSLTAVDRGPGQVLGVEFPSPQSQEELLAGCSIRLGDSRSLQDLLVSLRGRQVRLRLDQAEALAGILLGIDDAPQEEPLATALVSVLLKDSHWVQTAPLARVQGVEILDPAAAGDLRFFLNSSLTQESHRQVTVRLTPGEHDLALSYVAPAPTWRVSYRLVVEEGAGEGPEEDKREEGERRALLLGWGIFDNRLEEDLREISLSLVAGMPISFVYDLATPFTPQRPEVKEEGRVAAGPVEFGRAVAKAAPLRALAMDAAPEGAAMMRAAEPDSFGFSGQALDQSTVVAASGVDLGELFQYTIATPVTVGRGQSAMVPIVSAWLSCRKDLLYNGRKLPSHPVATLRMRNATGLTLERGPVTVIDAAQYAGEAVLPLTAIEAELVVPYAVELGVKVQEETAASRDIHALRITGHFLIVEEWDVRRQIYRLNNNTARMATVLVEHPRTPAFELFDSPAPREQTADQVRFAVQAPPREEAQLVVQERRLLSRREEIRRQSPRALQSFLAQGLLSHPVHDQLEALLALWERIAAHERRLVEIEQERQRVYQQQEQVRGNMAALGSAGKEGELRASYVERLRASESRLQSLAGEEQELKAANQRLNQEVDARLQALG